MSIEDLPVAFAVIASAWREADRLQAAHDEDCSPG